MTLTLVSFGGFSALVLLGAETGKAALSWDALFVFFGTLLLRAACIFVRRRGRGLSGLFLLLFSAAAYAGLCLPSSLFKQELIMLLSLPPVLWEKKEIALVVLLAVTALGLCLSLLRLGAQKGAPMDAVRFFLQCAAAAAAIAFYAVEDGSAFLTESFSPLLVGGAALFGLVLSAGLAAMRAAEKKQKRPKRP